jgi:subtilisin family serine protease
LGFWIGLMLGLGMVVALPLAAQRSAVRPEGRAIPRHATAATALTPERAAAFTEARMRQLRYLPGEVLVKFKSGVSVARQQRALSALRGQPAVDDLQWMAGGVARVRDTREADPVRAAAVLASQPDVEYAQPNYIRRLPYQVSRAIRPATLAPASRVTGVPNDPDYGVLQWNFSLLNMPRAWDINPGGSDAIIVAVIDTGVTTEAVTRSETLWTGTRFETVSLRFQPSPDFSTSRFVSPRDLLFDPGSASTLDFIGHGTHVASTIAEDANNQLGLAGMAYRVRIMPVKACVGFWELMLARAADNVTGYVPADAGGCSDDAMADGIRYAVDNGARVINISISGEDPAPDIRDAMAYAVSKGAFVAVAMGNAFEDGNPIEYPARYASNIDGVMSVGAVGKSSTRAYYSSTGGHLEVVAPGGNNRDGGGEDEGYVWQVTLHPDDSDPLLTAVPRFDRYAEVGYIGTSMAAPHVSALAALLMSQGITDPKIIEGAIAASAKDLGSSGRDDEYGAGLIQPRAALFGLGIRR